MSFTIWEIYFEAIRQDTTSEYLDTKLQLSNLFYHYIGHLWFHSNPANLQKTLKFHILVSIVTNYSVTPATMLTL
jgi:hypothetical protein